MIKKYSLKFWIIFWLIAILLLAGFYFLVEFKRNGLTGVSEKMPVNQEYKTALALYDYVLSGEEKTFLILFENNMEIRPGGGFLGSFGILKAKNGKVADFKIYDTGVFDKRVPDEIESPKPIQEKLNMKYLKLRDSNFSPDFKTNALLAEKFYKMGDGQEDLDGIIGITTNVLTSFLKVTGPVTLDGYPGTYGDRDAVLKLEYQVEKGFVEQGIERSERKGIMRELGRKVLGKAMTLGKVDQFKLTQIILEDLERKDIQLYFKDNELQNKVENIGWDGNMDSGWNKDFLMLVDANLGAWKSDYFVKRRVEYTVDLTQDTPRAHLKIAYHHTADQINWLTRDYLSYLQVFVNENSYLDRTENLTDQEFGKEFGKKIFKSYISILTGEEQVFEFFYSLPEELAENYELKIQKQLGMNDISWKVKIVQKDGNEKNFDFILNSDKIIK